MKKEILLLALLLVNLAFVSAQIEPEIYYKLNLDYNKGKINISSLKMELSQEKIENIFGFYTVEIFDYNDEILNLIFFDVPNKVLWDGINPVTGEIDKGGETELEQVSFEIFVPYYENAKGIIIYNDNLEEVGRKDVGEYSKQKPKQEVLKRDIGEEEKKEITETPKKDLTSKLIDYWWVLLMVVVILIIILIGSMIKKRN
jgi:hypothetical protein